MNAKRGKEREDFVESRKKAKQVADFYSGRSNQSREERESSPIIHLKKLNNWIKSVLIHLYVHKGDSVLDLACGKGGDLIKYDKANIGRYVGVDIAAGSIDDAMKRYNNRRQRLSFAAELFCGDCYEVDLERSIQGGFDVCSCQFALHYSWSTIERAERALDNVSRMLNPGGFFIGTMPDSNVIVQKLRAAQDLEFGNSVYNISFGEEHRTKVELLLLMNAVYLLFTFQRFPQATRFGIQYHFKLEDAVDCPEWLVFFPYFQSLAANYGLDLVLKLNFHDFVHKHIKDDHFIDLMRKLGALGDGSNGDTLSPDEWEAAYLYLVFVFKKRGEPGPRRQQNDRRRQWSMMKAEDIKKLVT
ncbi:mRNA cap guanine-N7 methyltransferase 1 isoform X1 [Selaginella moellendorffii]|uniref:mRNA cap guanine-N7 methyltransferase 1 isoform X1 n=1 Tax=Selaginella moellendorffii TaxID=88036 RepID=UPI000D1CA211|nr:mRNA cap guanine-N7 methyltransferase 1 isoform X1 [Selaginella moellendorffii]|eukprot:XP_024515157.1 mRNA cap guanine-N7 methyltransferase 1 isoform X1 [Selaginella moellendorffii]